MPMRAPVFPHNIWAHYPPSILYKSIAGRYWPAIDLQRMLAGYVRKRAFLHVRPAKIQISLRIPAV